MKHYLYTDKEFIYSTLSQIGKGLNLSYSQMSKNTSTESESTETSNIKENKILMVTLLEISEEKLVSK